MDAPGEIDKVGDDLQVEWCRLPIKWRSAKSRFLEHTAGQLRNLQKFLCTRNKNHRCEYLSESKTTFCFWRSVFDTHQIMWTDRAAAEEYFQLRYLSLPMLSIFDRESEQLTGVSPLLGDNIARIFEHFSPITIDLESSPFQRGFGVIKTRHVIYPGLLKVVLMDDYHHSLTHEWIKTRRDSCNRRLPIQIYDILHVRHD